jgi:hypothetical protein
MSASQSFINFPSTSALSSSAQIGGPIHDPSKWGCLCNDCLNNFILDRLQKAELADTLPQLGAVETALETLRTRQVTTAVTVLSIKRQFKELARRQRVLEKATRVAWKNVPGSYTQESSPAARCSKKVTHSGKRFIVISDDEEDDAGH